MKLLYYTNAQVKTFDNGLELFIIDMDGVQDYVVAKIMIFLNNKNISSIYTGKKEDIILAYSTKEINKVLEWVQSYSTDCPNQSIVENIIKDFIHDMSDRRGLKQSWYNIEQVEGTRLKKHWGDIIKAHIQDMSTPEDIPIISPTIMNKIKETLLSYSDFQKEWNEIDEDILDDINEAWTDIPNNHLRRVIFLKK